MGKERPIDKITIKGFKSIRELIDFKLQGINILIGANGAGKSNFVDFFWFLREMVEGRLQFTVRQQGGADRHLFMGPKVTPQLEVALYFGLNGYEFCLEPTVDNQFVFQYERVYYAGYYYSETRRDLGLGHQESKLKSSVGQWINDRIEDYVYPAVSSWMVYHFHDTSATASVRREHALRDNEKLRHDAANLAPFLYRLQEQYPETYQMIRETVRLAAPFFDDFWLRPQQAASGEETLFLEWRQKNSDYPFHPSQLSDGTLRFVALATALLQPNPPTTILLDEPELGLHPYALELLANLITQAATRTQLIVSTQSATLLNYFEPEKIVVVDRQDGETRFRRLDSDALAVWLDEEYTLGELWQKNVYGGGPVHE